MNILSRAQAVENGSLVYFTGMPCKHGHIAMRYVSRKGPANIPNDGRSVGDVLSIAKIDKIVGETRQ